MPFCGKEGRGKGADYRVREGMEGKGNKGVK